MDQQTSKSTAEAFEYLQRQIPSGLQSPTIGIICGSGLGGLADAVQPHPRYEVSYHDIPHFPISQVPGHAGKLLFGFLASTQTPVVLMIGRAHYFEGHSIQSVTMPIRLFKRLGVDTVIVTNASGGLNPDYKVGDIVVLNDHLNLAGLAGVNPLRGPNEDEFGVRFPPLSDAYDLELRRLTHKTWKGMKLSPEKRNLHEGIYAFVGGPSYETRAESRLLRASGADVVGMSTVPEIIVARHCNMRVLALSLVTNNVVLDPGPRGDDEKIQGLSRDDLTKALEEGKANHEEVLRAGREAASDVQQLVCSIIYSVFKMTSA